MDNYEILTRLGGGTFADVYKAIEKKTRELVAIKVLKKKYSSWEKCVELREYKSLKKLQEAASTSSYKGIKNLIKLKEIIYIKETGVLNLIFEYMEKDLFELMKERSRIKNLNENQIRSVVYQTLLGLSFMHKYGFFHRDLKPENLLVTGEIVKIADFGLAREIRSIPPYTEYVSTRYYRAPECILKSTNYNSPIDIWALGCIMAEMYLHPTPLFLGSNEKEVFIKICSILGTPTNETWNEGVQLAKKIDFKFPKSDGCPLQNVIANASEDAIDLMKFMIKWDPNQRATANNLLAHKFFNKYNYNLNRFNNIPYEYSDVNTSNSIILTNKNNSSKILKNSVKLTIKTKEELPNNLININKKDDEINFSRILNDTEGLDNLINKLKNEKYEEDLEFNNDNKNSIINSPMNIDKEFEFDPPTLTQNTLFLGNSTNFQGDQSSILNKNITHVTGMNNNSLIKNEGTLYDYTGKKIFDNSTINNINSGITMTSIAQNNSNDHILTNSSVDNNISTANNNILPPDDIKELMISTNISKIEPNNNDSEIFCNFDNAKILKPSNKNNRKFSARQFIENTQKDGTDFMNISKKGKENNNNNNNKNIKIPNKFDNNKFKFENNGFNFQRRGKQNITFNPIIDSINNKKISANNLRNMIQIENNNPNNNNNNNNVISRTESKKSNKLFGMESRRGKIINNKK
jgi:serine/threonine protein kinase